MENRYLMRAEIVEILEIGFPKSIIHRKGKPITELIDTHELVHELGLGYSKYHAIKAPY